MCVAQGYGGDAVMIEIIKDVVYQAATPKGFLDIDARKGEKLSLCKEAEKVLIGQGVAKRVSASHAPHVEK